MSVPDGIGNGNYLGVLAGQIVALCENVAVKGAGDFYVIIEDDSIHADLDAVVLGDFDESDFGGFGESGHDLGSFIG